MSELAIERETNNFTELRPRSLCMGYAEWRQCGCKEQHILALSRCRCCWRCLVQIAFNFLLWPFEADLLVRARKCRLNHIKFSDSPASASRTIYLVCNQSRYTVAGEIKHLTKRTLKMCTFMHKNFQRSCSPRASTRVRATRMHAITCTDGHALTKRYIMSEYIFVERFFLFSNIWSYKYKLPANAQATISSGDYEFEWNAARIGQPTNWQWTEEMGICAHKNTTLDKNRAHSATLVQIIFSSRKRSFVIYALRADGRISGVARADDEPM